MAESGAAESGAARARIDFPTRIGVWWASDTWPMQAAAEVAQEIEELGFGSLFIPEVGLKDCLVESAAFLAATRRLVVGTGIANIHARVPGTMEGGGRTLDCLASRQVRPGPRGEPRPAGAEHAGRNV